MDNNTSDSIKKFNKLYDAFVEDSSVLIDKLSENINKSTTSDMHKITPFLLRGIKLRSGGYKLGVALSEELSKLHSSTYYKVRTGGHRLSNLGETSPTVINGLIKGEEEYIKLDSDYQKLTEKLKDIEKISKIISDFSYHSKNKLDWEKFQAGQ